MYGDEGSICTVVVTREHAKVDFDLPPRCGPRRPHKKTTVTTESVQLQQPSLTTKHSTHSTTPPPASTTCTSRCCDGHLTVNVVNICDGCRLWSAESSSSYSAAQKRESDAGSDGDVSVSRRSRHDSTLSLDNVSLWEDSRDFTAGADGPLHTMTAIQSSAVDLTTADDDNNERCSENHATERPLSGRDKQHPAFYTASQRTVTPTTSAVIDLWQGSAPTQDLSVSAAACVDHGFIPSIIESSGRPATTNRFAADLANGSVELRQRRTGAGLDLYVRGMQPRFINNRDYSTTTTDEVEVTDGKITRLNDVTSSLPSHSLLNKVRLTSRWSCSALSFY